MEAVATAFHGLIILGMSVWVSINVDREGKYSIYIYLTYHSDNLIRFVYPSMTDSILVQDALCWVLSSYLVRVFNYHIIYYILISSSQILLLILISISLIYRYIHVGIHNIRLCPLYDPNDLLWVEQKYILRSLRHIHPIDRIWRGFPIYQQSTKRSYKEIRPSKTWPRRRAPSQPSKQYLSIHRYLSIDLSYHSIYILSILSILYILSISIHIHVDRPNLLRLTGYLQRSTSFCCTMSFWWPFAGQLPANSWFCLKSSLQGLYKRIPPQSIRL